MRKLLVAVLLFTAGSVADNLMTYWWVVVRGDFSEANPFVVSFIYSQPLYMWFLRDFAVLVLVIFTSLCCKKLILYLSRSDPPLKRAKALRVASWHWVIVLTVALIRFSAVIHNTLVVTIGYESPLTSLYKFLS